MGYLIGTFCPLRGSCCAAFPGAFKPAQGSAEHPQIEFKILWLVEFEFRQVGVRRIQKHLPFPTDGKAIA